MGIIVHEGEGVLFLNETDRFSGAIMLNGIVYDLTAYQGTSRNTGKPYIKISGRERAKPAMDVRAATPRRLPEALQKALQRQDQIFRRDKS